MEFFTTQELKIKPATVMAAALSGPALIVHKGRPKMVMMTMDEYARLSGRRKSAETPSDLDENTASAIIRGSHLAEK